jgi:uncharacterized membrane protein YoaT (DUF817 family)
VPEAPIRHSGGPERIQRPSASVWISPESTSGFEGEVEVGQPLDVREPGLSDQPRLAGPADQHGRPGCYGAGTYDHERSPTAYGAGMAVAHHQPSAGVEALPSHTPGAGRTHGLIQLLRFAWIELQACAFPIGVFAGLALAQVVPLPIARYDALLIWCLLLTFGFWVLGLESWREVVVIFGFHALGLALEIFKVHQGSWLYPGDAVTKLAGVPLFSGFMYAAVGSYICQAWRRFDLRVSHYPPVATTVIAIGVYLNFFTHHFVVDLRLPLAVTGLLVLRRCTVHFTVGDALYRMPLALSFVLIGFFLWVAENGATLLDAWKYPEQVTMWQVVHAAKLGAWALLVSMSFVLVASVKSLEGRLYHVPGAPRVTP